MSEKKVKKIHNFWNERAKEHKTSYLATVPDKFLKELEIKNILKYIPKKKIKVVDIGCGNGFSTIAFAKERQADFLGVDYSENMIEQAQKILLQRKKKIKGKVRFISGNILNLNFLSPATHDIVSTDRCLINLVSLSDQKKAIKEISRVLKKGGKYIMCEDTKEGLRKLNELRILAGLEAIPNHWHNLYLNEKELLPYIERYFKIIKIDNFSSLYYIASRIFNAVSAIDIKTPNYLSVINKTATKLPSIGDYSPLKIFYLEKK
ncbi:MAG: class I SAM-dependent methyltransferase [Patescibacteria group bacterium]|jgi:ubiquinone/menaquinone biosynthesis C-methylase UbiE